MAKESTVRTYMKYTLDPLFSKYIRLKEAKGCGYVRCVSCGDIKPWQEMDAGHYVGREKWATRYDERNVHSQCVPCNRFGEGNKAEYAVYLMAEYGKDILLTLTNLGNTQKQYRLPELKEMAKFCRQEIKKMLAMENC